VADGSEAGIIIPAYWSGDNSKFTYAAATMPSGTILCGAPGFDNALPWYGSESGPSGSGSGQAQSRDSAAASAIAACHGAGLKVLPYIAVNGGHAGTGYDGHYSDLNAVLGKIDKAYANYPEYDGVFLDEASILQSGESFMLACVARIHSHGGIAISNMASAQVYSGAINYGDYVVLAETVWDGSTGFGGPYGAITNPGDGNFIYQPDYVDNAWPKNKIIYWICGVPNVAGMARAARKTLYESHNVGNIYLSNHAPYDQRWASPADNPLWSEQAGLMGAVIPPGPTTPLIGGVGATIGAGGTTATIDATGNESFDWTVDYGTTTAYGSTATQASVIRMLLTLTGLTPGTTYHYRITARDSLGRVVITNDSTFLTTVTPDPTPTPTPTGPTSAIRAIQESPFANGQLAAIAGHSLLRSFDQGGTWDTTLQYADAALTATRLATGAYGPAGAAQKNLAYVTFAGTSTNTQSRILEEGKDTTVGWATAPQDVQPSGLTLGLADPTLYVVDAQGTGKTWVLDTGDVGGNFAAGAWDVSFGKPQHIIRDGAVENVVWGAAISAIWKSWDRFISVHKVLNLDSPRVGKMVGYGKLRHAPTVEGDLYASTYLVPFGTSINYNGRTTNKIVKLSGTTWTAVADHPIPLSEHIALRQGVGWCNYGLCTLDTGFAMPALESSMQYHRPMLLGADGSFYTWCFTLWDGLLISVTPTYHNLYKSIDKGATWTALTGIGGVLDLAIASDGALWVTNADGRRVSRSGDGGTTWVEKIDRSPSQLAPGGAVSGIFAFSDKYTGIACDPTSPLGVVVRANGGYFRTANGSTFSFFACPEYSFASIGFPIERTPTGTATLIGASSTITLGAFATKRINDGETGSFAGDTDVVLGSGTLTHPRGWLTDRPNAYRRLGSRLFVLGDTLEDDFAGFGTCYVSTDDGRSWARLFEPHALDALNVQNTYPCNDLGYDTATDTLYAGLKRGSIAGGSPNSAPFIKRVGTGAWQDLSATMVAGLGDTYVSHLKGMIVGVR
jgi:hypothetical protein